MNHLNNLDKIEEKLTKEVIAREKRKPFKVSGRSIFKIKEIIQRKGRNPKRKGEKGVEEK